MLGLGSVTTDNIIERYKARFRPDDQSRQMLYLANEKTIPARLSIEQYDHYLSEFESFVNRGKCKLFFGDLQVFLAAIIQDDI